MLSMWRVYSSHNNKHIDTILAKSKSPVQAEHIQHVLKTQNKYAFPFYVLSAGKKTQALLNPA